MPDPHLERVTQATTDKVNGDTEYRQAIRDAILNGYTYADIGRAAGITRQAVQQLAQKEEK